MYRFVPNFEVCTILGGFGKNLGSECALIGSAVLSLPQAHEVVWGIRFFGLPHSARDGTSYVTTQNVIFGHAARKWPLLSKKNVLG